MRLPPLDSGRLFSAKIAFRTGPFIQLNAGDFAEPFPPPLRASLRARRSSLGRAPQRAARPLIPGRARPAPAPTRLLRRLGASALDATMLKRQTALFGQTKRKAPSHRRGATALGVCCGPRQAMTPHFLMVASSFSRFAGASSQSGSRYSSAIFPIAASAALTGIGLLSTKRSRNSG